MSGARRLLALILFAGLLISPAGSARVDVVSAQGIVLAPVATGFSQSLGVVEPPDGTDRLFVVERTGAIRIVTGGQVLPTPFLDVSSLIVAAGSEQGLLGLAFHPNYASNGLFFIYYTAAGSGANTLARYHVSADPDRANPASATILFAIPDRFANHNGGHLLFGPDGYLYVGTGDGGSAGDPDNHGQSLDTLLGKILRLDVDNGFPYAVPPTNPFVGRPGARGEIWAYGLRNPWRFSFDRITGDLYIADVGQNQYEEVNFQPASSGGGQNYGWNLMEGFHCFDAATCDQTGLTLPVAEYAHGQGDCSVTGGYVYRGSAAPSLAGAYLYADFCSGRIWTLRRLPGGAWSSSLLLDTPRQVSSFGEDRDGDLYLVDLQGGVYRFTEPGAATTTPARTATRTATPTVAAGSVGGRGFTLRVITGGTTVLTWSAGTVETGYILLLYTPNGNLPVTLGAGVQSYTDTLGLPNTCYLLGPIQGSTLLGISDLLCVFRNIQSGVAPSVLGISLGGTTTATLSWSAVPIADSYILQPIGASLAGAVPASTLSVTRPISGPTCYVVGPFNGSTLLGVTNAVCAWPGFNTLGG
jgi:glucose/arabinose dehydrogenase